MENRKVLFFTSSRADFCKLKPLIKVLIDSGHFDINIFATGMHCDAKYGFTIDEINRCFPDKVFGFPSNNRNLDQSNNMYIINAFNNILSGFNDFVCRVQPDLIVIHGDRSDTLASAIVSIQNRIKLAHVEGGELSGNIDEIFRHSITKLSHIHFVSNSEARERVIQMGEDPRFVFDIGSPEIEIMVNGDNVSLETVKKRYHIPFEHYSIVLYHPPTSDTEDIQNKIKALVGALNKSNKNYIVIYPNNDLGSDIIIDAYGDLVTNNIRVFKSIEFESFITLFKHCDFIIGNSSAGIRHSGIYRRKCINLGDRQRNRHNSKNIITIPDDNEDIILKTINCLDISETEYDFFFGDGNGVKDFLRIMLNQATWKLGFNKQFVSCSRNFETVFSRSTRD